MPRGSPERTAARKEEIIAACEGLYQTMSFRDITIQEIAKSTSFTRPSIYNYFDTKEEIFLALLQKEYERWTADLDAVTAGPGRMGRDQAAQALARSLEQRIQLLKLLSTGHFDMEANSRPERLTEFKAAYGGSMSAVDRLLGRFCPEMGPEDRRDFLYSFFPFLFGVYPYSVVTEKQRAAMEAAGVGYIYRSVYELVYLCAKRLLGAGRTDR